MYLYIIIGILVVIVLLSLNKKNTKEHFESCYLNVGNTKKNGDKTFFTNYMFDDYLNRSQQVSNLKGRDEDTVKTLEKFKKNIFDSNNNYNKLNDQYNQFNNNMEQEFSKLNNQLQSKIQETKQMKQDAINKFTRIEGKMVQVVGNSESSLESKLTPTITSGINNNLDELTSKTINETNINNMFNNRMSSLNSDINNWKIIPGYGSPMRVDPATGNIQCLSYNGRDCEWNYVNQNGNELSKIDKSRVKPLSCGMDHKRLWGGVGYETDSHWCKKVNDIYSSSNINEVDWSNCPVGWTNLDKEGNLCQAPSDYTGRCSRVSTFAGYSPANKQSWAASCTARWPFKVNINNMVKNMGDIPSTINEDVNNKLGKIVAKTDLDKFNTYSNGVYVKAYRLTNNNSPGELIRDGIITTNINFNWGVGLVFGIRDNPNQTDTNMIYLEMIGYIKVPAGATSIKFRLGSDDGSRLRIAENGEIANIKTIVDMWQAQGHTTKESSNLSVKPNTFLPFVVQFFENYGAASLVLEWSVNGAAFAIVPRDNFYINKELCNSKFNFDLIDQINKQNVDTQKCNWQNQSGCIFKDYVKQGDSCVVPGNNNPAYSVSGLATYSQGNLTSWLQALYQRNGGNDKAKGEAVNVSNYISSCQNVPGYEFLKSLGENLQREQTNITADSAIVRGISPTLISWNWSPFNFSSYANGNCPCRAGYRLVYVYNGNVVSQVSGENWAHNCPTYCNPVLTFNINVGNISGINDISKLKLVLQVNKNNGVWVNSSCPGLQVAKNQSTYVFNCATSQS